MPPKSEKPSLLARLSRFVMGRGGRSSSSAPSQAVSPGVSFFKSARNVRTGDLNINANNVNVFNEGGAQEHAQRARLETLPKHPPMSTKRNEYLPNSRQPDVDKLCERESSSTDLVLCIHGPAGIGKSTLAGHLTDEFRESGRLAASIFLGVVPVEMSEPETIVKMISHEIGSIHPRAIPKIVKAMDQRHGTSLEAHLQGYIVEPLQSLGHPQPLIIIMDALDEWRNHQTFLKALAALNSESSVVKFFLTGRLNPCAYHSPDIDKVSIYTYALGPISKEVIKAYFHKYLAKVRWVDGRKASSADVEKLTELSGGLPVWASTVIGLLSHPFSKSPPHEVLAEIVGCRRQVGGSDGLGELYRNALMRLFPSSDAQEYFRRHMGATIALQESLTIADFSTLSGVPSHLIPEIQFSLSALQIRSPLPGSERMVHPATTLHHLSLLEYLQAPTTEASFAVSTFDSHSAIGLTCFKQLSTLPPSSFPRLRALQRYAVKYWLHHVFNGTPRSNDQWSQSEHCSALQMMPDIHGRWAASFLKDRTPEEVDSILEDVRADSMVSTLRKVADWLGKSGGDHWGFQVACLEVAVRIDGGNTEAWSDLGRCYYTRGDQTGNLRMNEEAVVVFRQALNLRPDPHPSRGDSFDDVAGALRSCYQQNGDLNILNEAISCDHMAVTLSPTPHPDRARYIGNLANALTDLYHHDGDLTTLDKIISLLRDALALRPAPHPRHPWSLNSLANALHNLYQLNGDIKALDEAVLLHRKALALRPLSNTDRPVSLSNLASVLRSLYRHNEDLNTLNEAISLEREGLGLRPAHHPGRSVSLNNLTSYLLLLYQHNKDIGTLDECISLGREALALRPVPHPDRHTMLWNLARAYLSQFEQNRAVKVLDEGISLAREWPALCRPGHRYRAEYLKFLVRLLKRRWEFTGDDQDCGVREIEDWETELGN